MMRRILLTGFLMAAPLVAAAQDYLPQLYDVTVVETWDTLGMRGTGSHDIQLTEVFVADAQIAGRRQIGQIDPSLRNALLHFAPLVASVYYGIAAAARDEAIDRELVQVGGRWALQAIAVAASPAAAVTARPARAPATDSSR